MGRELPQGTAVGAYSIERLRERTGLSEVYTARGPSGALCRLSFFHIDPDGLPWKRFLAESQQVRALSHPCLAEVAETAVSSDGRPYQVLVLGDGEDLGTRLRRGALTVDEALVCADQIGAALLALHSLDLSHRGLCPDRIFLSSPSDPVQPRVRILDAGVTRLLDDSLPGVLAGNPEYKAPEQLSGLSIDVGPAVDQYTLALLLYQALTSSRPFKADSPAATILQVVRGGAEPLRVLRPDVSRNLDAAMMRALGKERQSRFPSVAEFLTALRGGQEVTPAIDALVGNWLRKSESAQAAIQNAQAQADSKPSFQVVALGMADASAGGVPEVVEDQATVPNAMDEVMRLALPIEQVPLVPSSAVAAPKSGPVASSAPIVISSPIIVDSRPTALASGPAIASEKTDPQQALSQAAPRSGISEQSTGPTSQSDRTDKTALAGPQPIAGPSQSLADGTAGPSTFLRSPMTERAVIALIGLVIGFLLRHLIG